MIGFAVYEITPAPWGNDYRFICIRETKERAEKVLDVLYGTDIGFSLYQIVEHKRLANGVLR